MFYSSCITGRECESGENLSLILGLFAPGCADQGDVYGWQAGGGSVPAQLPVHQQLVLAQQVSHPDPEPRGPPPGKHSLLPRSKQRVFLNTWRHVEPLTARPRSHLAAVGQPLGSAAVETSSSSVLVVAVAEDGAQFKYRAGSCYVWLRTST